MEQEVNFRSSVGGYKKDDVIEYVENTNEEIFRMKKEREEEAAGYQARIQELEALLRQEETNSSQLAEEQSRKLQRLEGENQRLQEDLDKMEDLCYYIKENSLCGLGQSAPNPVLSTLKYFRDEYIAHIQDKRCPAGVCKELLQYTIDPQKCRGCTLCAKVCPAGAITGTVKEPHVIDPGKCLKCGACMEKCRFGAIVRK